MLRLVNVVVDAVAFLQFSRVLLIWKCFGQSSVCLSLCADRSLLKSSALVAVFVYVDSSHKRAEFHLDILADEMMTDVESHWYGLVVVVLPDAWFDSTELCLVVLG